jgi:hypothetical protein
VRVLLALFGIFAVANGFALPQVAVLRTAVSAGIDPTVAEPITEKIIEALVDSGKYLVLDRLNIDKVLTEKEFQFSSAVVSQAEMRRAGEYLGADLVLFASISRVGSTHILSCKMVDVTTGAITAQVSEERKGSIDVLLEAAQAAGERIAKTAVVTGPGGGSQKAAQAALPGAAGPPSGQPQADASAAELDNLFVLRGLLDDRAFLRSAGAREISSMARGIGEDTRAKLYDSYKAGSAIGYSALNLILSLGSWVQGDFKSALIIDSIVVAGIAGGYVVSTPLELGFGTGMTVGVSLGIVAEILGFVLPYNYASNYNKNLRKSLLLVTSPPGPAPVLASLSGIPVLFADLGLKIPLWRLEL